MKRFRPGWAAMAAAAPLALAAPAAWAHAHLVQATPAADTAAPAPAVLHLKFNEKLEARFSGVELRKGSAAVAVDVKASGDTIDVTPRAKLTAGAYTVAWHALSVDGHKSAGQYAFMVK